MILFLIFYSIKRNISIDWPKKKGLFLEAFEVIDIIRKCFVVDPIPGAAAFFFRLQKIYFDQLFQMVRDGGLGEVKAFGDRGALGPFGVLPDIFQHLDPVGIAQGFAHALQSFAI
jgi:hypothetical protein